MNTCVYIYLYMCIGFGSIFYHGLVSKSETRSILAAVESLLFQHAHTQILHFWNMYKYMFKNHT
jgi:hypothetical protein